MAEKIATNRQGDRAKDKFYGPNLPQAWADAGDGDDYSGVGVGAGDMNSGYDSPSEEVKRMLDRKAKHGTALSPTRNLRQEQEDRELTIAYQRSQAKSRGLRKSVAYDIKKHELDPRAALVCEYVGVMFRC